MLHRQGELTLSLLFKALPKVIQEHPDLAIIADQQPSLETKDPSSIIGGTAEEDRSEDSVEGWRVCCECIWGNGVLSEEGIAILKSVEERLQALIDI
jgi:hypothetical protein